MGLSILCFVLSALKNLMIIVIPEVKNLKSSIFAAILQE